MELNNAKYPDLSVSRQTTDLLTTHKSQYFAQPHSTIFTYNWFKILYFILIGSLWIAWTPNFEMANSTLG